MMMMMIKMMMMTLVLHAPGCTCILLGLPATLMPSVKPDSRTLRQYTAVVLLCFYDPISDNDNIWNFVPLENTFQWDQEEIIANQWNLTHTISSREQLSFSASLTWYTWSISRDFDIEYLDQFWIIKEGFVKERNNHLIGIFSMWKEERVLRDLGVTCEIERDFNLFRTLSISLSLQSAVQKCGLPFLSLCHIVMFCGI